MALRYLIVDDSTGAIIRGSVLGYFEQDFTVTTAQSQFTIVGATFDSGTKIKVYQNGQLKREGSTNDWQRDVGNNRINFNNSLTNAWVHVEIY